MPAPALTAHIPRARRGRRIAERMRDVAHERGEVDDVAERVQVMKTMVARAPSEDGRAV